MADDISLDSAVLFAASRKRNELYSRRCNINAGATTAGGAVAYGVRMDISCAFIATQTTRGCEFPDQNAVPKNTDQILLLNIIF